MCLTIFWKGQKTSLDYKKKVKKSRRLRIFPKGLVHGFGQKFEIFPCFYYQQNQLARCVFDDILELKEKKVFLDSKIRKSKNFSMFLFLAKPNRKTCLKIYQEGKKAFLRPKIRKLKKSKNQDFSKGVSLWFWSKIGNFSMILFLSKSDRKTCLKISQEGKKAFSDSKIRKLKKSKNRDFSKGVSPWSWSKI